MQIFSQGIRRYSHPNRVRCGPQERVDTNPVCIVVQRFNVWVNIDAASLYQDTRLDFRDADLRAIGARLGSACAAPMPLRVGGSSADDVWRSVQRSCAASSVWSARCRRRRPNSGL